MYENTVSFFASKTGGIIISIAIAAGLVLSAYYLSIYKNPIANAASSDELLKAYAAKDTDGDGVPDWEEALYGTDPAKADTLGNGLGDAVSIQKGLIPLKYKVSAPTASGSGSSTIAANIPGVSAAPGTLTDQFAQTFFKNYIATRGTNPPSADEQAAFIKGAITNLEQTRSRPTAFSVSDIRVSGSGASALISYAKNVEGAFSANDPHTQQNEVTYLGDAVNKNDPIAIKNLSLIANGYRNTAKALSQVTAPTELKTSHLALINAMSRLGDTIDDMGSVQSDPIRGMLGLESYTNDAKTLAQAFASIGTDFPATGVALSKGQPGYFFYNLTTSSTRTASTTP
jgi:hypothetical protein